LPDRIAERAPERQPELSAEDKANARRDPPTSSADLAISDTDIPSFRSENVRRGVVQIRPRNKYPTRRHDPEKKRW
jgi:hypothetical protein